MTNGLDFDALAKEPRKSVEALAARLSELRSHGATILECIKYVKLNRECPLSEAMGIVVNSQTWADKRDAFLRHQQEMFEEFIADSKDQIESIEMTFTPDRTETIVRMKTPPEQG